MAQLEGSNSNCNADLHINVDEVKEEQIEGSVSHSAASAVAANKSGTVKLVIYDFDQTITTLHLYRKLRGGKNAALAKFPDHKLIEVFGGEQRIQILHEHFKYLSSQCIELCIVSFGWTEVIQSALRRVHLDIYFRNTAILGRDSKELIAHNRAKGKVVESLMRQKKLKYEQVLFVDDDSRNIQQTHRICKTLLIPNRKGMTIDQMNTIEQSVCVANSEQEQTSMSAKQRQSLNNAHKRKQRQNDENAQNHNGFVKRKSSSNSLAKYKITNVPQWFEDLSKKKENTPVVEITDDAFPDHSHEADGNHHYFSNDVKVAATFTFGCVHND